MPKFLVYIESPPDYAAALPISRRGTPEFPQMVLFESSGNPVSHVEATILAKYPGSRITLYRATYAWVPTTHVRDDASLK
jgi:hypothetical protein